MITRSRKTEGPPHPRGGGADGISRDAACARAGTAALRAGSSDDEDDEDSEDSDYDADDEGEEDEEPQPPQKSGKRSVPAAAVAEPKPKAKKARQAEGGAAAVAVAEPKPKAKKARQAAGDAAAAGPSGGAASVDAQAYEAALVAHLAKQPGRTAKMPTLGSAVKKPAGVPKVSAFVRSRPALFRHDDREGTVTLLQS
jgi:hypothetical protein